MSTNKNDHLTNNKSIDNANEGLELITKSVALDESKQQENQPQVKTEVKSEKLATPSNLSLTQQIALDLNIVKSDKTSQNEIKKPSEVETNKIPLHTREAISPNVVPTKVQSNPSIAIPNPVTPTSPSNLQAANVKTQPSVLTQTPLQPQVTSMPKPQSSFQSSQGENKQEGLSIKFTPSNAQANTNNNQPNFAVKKTPEQIARENAMMAQRAKINSTGADDINSSQLGIFTKKAEIKPEQPVIKVDESSEHEKSKVRLNFEKFTNKKKKKVKTIKTSAFGEKINILLRSKKGLKWTWIIELLVVAILLAVGITFICLINPNIGSVMPEWIEQQGIAMIGTIFCYITTCSWALPAIFLLTAWFVGVNGVTQSKAFHYFIWGMGTINIVLFIVELITCLIPLISALTFHM